MYFTIEKRGTGFRAYLKGGNHEVVWWTETYTTKASAQHAISLAKQAGVNTPVYDLTA